MRSTSVLKALIAISSSFAIAGCTVNELSEQFVFPPTKEEIVKDAIPLNKENAEAYVAKMTQPSAPDLESAWSIQGEKLRTDLEIEVIQNHEDSRFDWQFFTMPITLTKDMYKPDWGVFTIPINTIFLEGVGAIDSNYDVVVTSATNVAAIDNERPHKGTYYNRHAMRGIVSLAAIDSDETYNKAFKTDPYYRNTYDDKKKNALLMERYLTGWLDALLQGYTTEEFSYYYFLKDPRRLNTGYASVRATPKEAVELVDSKAQYTIKFRPQFAFKAPRTDQVFLLVNGTENYGLYDSEDNLVFDRDLVGDLWPEQTYLRTVTVRDHEEKVRDNLKVQWYP